jgi:putative (di)nucleoside polyphosphate hydrolase
MTEELYRPCVGVMLLNREGLAFLGRRLSERSDPEVAGFEWQMPQGGIDEGETPFAAALRELHEETNVTSVELLGESRDWYSYDLPPSASKRWKGRFRGQTQKWFALRFTGDEGEIDIKRPAGGAHEPEFGAWRWERPTLLPKLIVPFKRDVYELVLSDFRHLTGGA